jgi:hypothetical protein
VTQSYAAEQHRKALFGDTHIHTMYSMDAFAALNVRTSPDVAYRYAKGEAIPHPNGGKIRMSGPPLDFLMVADHASFLGINAALLDPSSPTFGHPDGKMLLPEKPMTISATVRQLRRLGSENHELVSNEVRADAWQKTIQAAERHNEAGVFTAFIGYEYTPTPGGRHLHRNVMFRGSNVPDLPFSSLDSGDPKELWDWMDLQRGQGIETLAIPHNMNQSDGLAFQTTTWQGEPINEEFARQRMRNEPIAEISQQKGTSETHPSLSPNDEWANFQIVQYYLNRAENKNPISVFKGGYYRDALLTGLTMQATSGFNPYALGNIGASDSHSTGAAYAEDNYFSAGPSSPLSRGSAYPNYQRGDDDQKWQGFWTPRQATHGTGGLAGVWADANTRADIFDAIRRKETFSTSGPRILVRFFGGFQITPSIMANRAWLPQAYADGVPMGGVLTGSGQSKATESAPNFLVWAQRAPQSAWLQRIQIVKGWVDNGTAKEMVFDIACSDGLVPDPTTHRCPDNNAKVNIDDCSVSRDVGAVQLRTVWQDPDFDETQHAFYYTRVLENPTCRWSTWDAVRLGIKPNPDLPSIHQERAWSSPIWYQPKD